MQQISSPQTCFVSYVVTASVPKACYIIGRAACMSRSGAFLDRAQSCACITAFDLGREVDAGQVRIAGPDALLTSQVFLPAGLPGGEGLSRILCPTSAPSCLDPELVDIYYTLVSPGPVCSTHYKRSRPAYSTASD